MSQTICKDCGNLFHGRECDLCAPMARTFARMKLTARLPRLERKRKGPAEKRKWEAGQDRACPPEREG